MKTVGELASYLTTLKEPKTFFGDELVVVVSDEYNLFDERLVAFRYLKTYLPLKDTTSINDLIDILLEIRENNKLENEIKGLTGYDKNYFAKATHDDSELVFSVEKKVRYRIKGVKEWQVKVLKKDFSY